MPVNHPSVIRADTANAHFREKVAADCVNNAPGAIGTETNGVVEMNKKISSGLAVSRRAVWSAGCVQKLLELRPPLEKLPLPHAFAADLECAAESRSRRSAT